MNAMHPDFLVFPYKLILRLRHFLYDKGIRKSVSAGVPTICVGNITVGGTGKTPHTEMILRMLLSDSRFGGTHIAVLSRGYKRRSRGFQQISEYSKASFSGDEPLQIKKKFPQVTVAVDSDRVEGCNLLTHPELLQGRKRRYRRCVNKDFPAAGLIILDDAFQYRKLRASLNIVLVDWNRPVHKDSLLPFGRLRDLPERLSKADVIIVTKCPCELDNWERTSFAYALGLPDYASSTCTGTTASGKKQRVFFTTISYETPRTLFPESNPRYIYSKRLVLFTGIANDTPLRRYLGDTYKIVQRFSFPDHHSFTRGDFRKIGRAASHCPTAALATTEKDAQRVLDFGKVPDALREKMFQIPIRATFLSEAEERMFLDILESLI